MRTVVAICLVAGVLFVGATSINKAFYDCKIDHLPCIEFKSVKSPA